MARKRRRRRRGGGGGGALARRTTYVINRPAPRRRRMVPGSAYAKGRIALTAAGAAYGYLHSQVKPFQDIEGKLPKIGNAAITTGIAMHFVAKMTRNKYVDMFSTAALAVGGYQLGEAGFKLSGVEDATGEIGGDFVGAIDADAVEAAYAAAMDADDDNDDVAA